jgi:pyruvate dehydrogenase E2 component (dihydrolipoamide acetyltransferase)
MGSITPIKMPKWGLSMQEGTVVHWWKATGDAIAEGEDLVDIETTKITNTLEAPDSGVLRRIVAAEQETLPVGGLIAVLANPEVSDADVDSFIATFQANFVPEPEDSEAVGVLQFSRVTVEGRQIHVGQTGGEGTPIVLLHGFAGDLNGWLFNIDALREVGPVVALDLPGHGASAKDVGDGSLLSLAAIVASALDQLGMSQAHLVGHSLGAAVAIQIALLRPGLARSLILIAPAGLEGANVSEAFLDGVVDAQNVRRLRGVLETLVAEPALISKDMVDGVMRFKRLDGAEEALGILRDRMVEGSDFRKLQAELDGLPNALVIASRSDRIVGAPDETAFPAGWRVAWIEGAGHMPHLEKSADVNALILGALTAAKES